MTRGLAKPRHFVNRHGREVGEGRFTRQPGQVRKEAAPATDTSAGGQARHLLIFKIAP